MIPDNIYMERLVKLHPVIVPRKGPLMSFQDAKITILLDYMNSYWLIAGEICEVLGYYEGSFEATERYCRHCRKLDYSQAMDLGIPIGNLHGIIMINKKDLWNLVSRTSVDSSIGRKLHQAVEYTVGDFLVKEVNDQEDAGSDTAPGAEPAVAPAASDDSAGKEIMVFKFDGHPVTHIFGADGSLSYVAKEVCDILGYARSNDAVKQHCKHAKLLKHGEIPYLEIPPRGTYIIPESDLYRLIIKSKLPAAEKFERWVMEEVLPAIRKTGRFDVKAPKTDKEQALFFAQQLIEESARNEKLTHENVKLTDANDRLSYANGKLSNVNDQLSNANTLLFEENVVLTREKVRLQEILDEAEPRLQTYSQFFKAQDTYLPSEAAKIIGVGPKKFTRTLRFYKYLMKNNLPVSGCGRRG